MQQATHDLKKAAEVREKRKKEKEKEERERERERDKTNIYILKNNPH